MICFRLSSISHFSWIHTTNLCIISCQQSRNSFQQSQIEKNSWMLGTFQLLQSKAPFSPSVYVILHRLPPISLKEEKQITTKRNCRWPKRSMPISSHCPSKHLRHDLRINNISCTLARYLEVASRRNHTTITKRKVRVRICKLNDSTGAFPTQKGIKSLLWLGHKFHIQGTRRD